MHANKYSVPIEATVITINVITDVSFGTIISILKSAGTVAKCRVAGGKLIAAVLWQPIAQKRQNSSAILNRFILHLSCLYLHLVRTQFLQDPAVMSGLA